LTEEQKEKISVRVKNATVTTLSLTKKENTKKENMRIATYKSKWALSSIKIAAIFSDLDSFSWISDGPTSTEYANNVRNSLVNSLVNSMVYYRHATRWSKDFDEKKHDILNLENLFPFPKGYYKNYVNSYV